MKTSDIGLNLIKQFEGCKLTAYKCPAGVLTIGYGHTGDVRAGKKITQAQADELLKKDVIRFEKHVEKYDNKYHWTQNEFDALVSFAYNIGNIDQLTAKGTRTKAQISAKILEYNKAGGKVLTGLKKRRAAEKALFDSGNNANLVKISEAKKSFKVSVTAKSGLNCRVDCSVNASKVCAFKYGTVLEITDEKDGWGKCYKGWISLKYTKKV